jgi:hypothetical protein
MNFQVLFYSLLLTLAACSGDSNLSDGGKASQSEKTETAETSGQKSSNAKQTSEIEVEEEEDEDLRIIPPEIVSGAYLVCNTTETSTHVDHGCNAHNAATDELLVDGYDIEWTLINKRRETIDADLIESETYQVQWRMSLEQAKDGVYTELEVPTKGGRAVVRQPGVTWHNGALLEK